MPLPTLPADMTTILAGVQSWISAVLHEVDMTPGTPSSVVLTIAGSPGAIVPLTLVAQHSSGSIWRSTAATVVGVGGTVDVTFAAILRGPQVALAASAWTLIGTNPGLTGATNLADAVLGTADTGPWIGNGIVYRMNQDAPNPPGTTYPYAAWLLKTPVREGRSWNGMTQTSPVLASAVSEHDAVMTLSVDLFDRAPASAPGRTVMAAAMTLEAASQDPTRLAELDAVGLAVVRTLLLSDISRVSGARFESRYVLDLLLRGRVRLTRGSADWLAPVLPVAEIVTDEIHGTLIV